MTEATRKLRALALRFRRDASARQTDAAADLRELDEIDALLADEATEPGTPTSKSQEMRAVAAGVAARVGSILEEGRAPGPDRRR
jgi:hypothetical protein